MQHAMNKNELKRKKNKRYNNIIKQKRREQNYLSTIRDIICNN